MIQYHPVPALVFFRDKTDKNLVQAVGYRLVEITTLSLLHISTAINNLPLVLNIIFLASKSLPTLLVANINAFLMSNKQHMTCHRLGLADPTSVNKVQEQTR